MSDRHLPEALGRATNQGLDYRTLRGLGDAAVSSMRRAGAGAVGGGRWLAETTLDVVPHLPVRGLDTLVEHHHGLTGDALAAELVRNAARATATVGAATGALAAAEGFAPPAWLTIPVELILETLAVAAIEMKLVAELHETYGQPVPGQGRERALILARSWAERRGITATTFMSGGGLSEVLGRGTRNEIMRILQRRMLRRTVRNTATFVPFLIGAVAGAELNRRATTAVGTAIVRDLTGRQGRFRRRSGGRLS
jgi:hypothetical protein